MGDRDMASAAVRAARGLGREFRARFGRRPRPTAESIPQGELESVTLRVRLMSVRALEAIKAQGLHEEMRSRCADEVRRSIEATVHIYSADDEPHLDAVIRSLAANLRAMPGLSAAVHEADQLGSTSLVEDDYFEAMALWLVDNQLGDGLLWNPSTPIRRRNPPQPSEG